MIPMSITVPVAANNHHGVSLVAFRGSEHDTQRAIAAPRVPDHNRGAARSLGQALLRRPGGMGHALYSVCSWRTGRRRDVCSVGACSGTHRLPADHALWLEPAV